MSQADIEAIKQLKARYFRFLDTQQWDEWQEVFTTDVFIDTVDDAGPGSEITGNAEFRTSLEPMLAGAITLHHGHMPEIEITGDGEATGIWAMEDYILFSEESGMGELNGSGWYHETYRRGSDGQWRIASMRLARQRVVLGGNQIFPR